MLPEFVYSKVYFTCIDVKNEYEEGKCECLNKKQNKVLNCHTIVRFFLQTPSLRVIRLFNSHKKELLWFMVIYCN